MSARTVTLPGGRSATLIPADEAGEFLLSAAEGLLQHLEQGGLLTWRQVTAAAELARLYGIGGGQSPHRRSGGGDRCGRPCAMDGKCDCVVAAARRDFMALLSHAPRRCHYPLIVLSMGQMWQADLDPLALLREGLTAVADWLKLAPEVG